MMDICSSCVYCDCLPDFCPCDTCLEMYHETGKLPLYSRAEPRCKFCGGKLSEIWYNSEKPYQHCFGCHFDYEVEI